MLAVLHLGAVRQGYTGFAYGC
ncbi:hypothetical protein MNBD_CHLOROFLEXI01-4615, partial [hydrothermal vent metagenome]